MKVAILGAGAFGKAIAHAILKNNYYVNIWTKVEKEVGDITDFFKNDFRGKFAVSTNIKEIICNCDLVFLIVPTTFIHDTIIELSDYIKPNQSICIASKGFDTKTGKFITHVINDILPNNNYAVISGPSFAIDILENKPVSMNIASSSRDLFKKVEDVLMNENISLSYTDDIIGVEICGACKNILAIGMGILSGMKASDSTKAAFFTKSINDINKIILGFQGNTNTIISLAGIGDIFLTCTSTKSRNFSFGYILGTKNHNKIKSYKQNNTIEGISSLQIIYHLLINKNLQIEFIEKLYSIVFKKQSPDILINLLTK